MADVAMSPIGYGFEKTGKWREVPEGDWEEQVMEPEKVYEFNYEISEVPSWLRWLPWCKTFDPERYILELRGELATKMGVTPEEIRIPWFYYNPENRHFAVQVQYVPRVQAYGVGAVLPPLIQISVLVVAVTMLLTAFGVIFKESPVLVMIKELTEEAKEWMGELGVVMKYVAYIVIGGGSIWLAAKIIPKLKKLKLKKKKAEA